MAMLLLTPACKDYLWGGTKLREAWGIRSPLDPLAEAWMLSCHRDGLSTLPDGRTLAEYVRSHPGCLGRSCERFEDFPVLIKLIDAKATLSIQVHPGDEYARLHEGEFGKDEFWYILDHEPGAFLYYGLSRPVSREELRQRIRENTLLEVLNAVPVHRGDSFFLPAGTLHAIGKGILLAEVQENSNVTYRVYDYGRPRALHIGQALAVAACRPCVNERRTDGHLVKCRYFTTDLRQGPFVCSCDESSFLSLLLLDGCGQVTNGDQTLEVKKADSLFIPAGSGRVEVTGQCTVLCTYLEE